MVSLWAALLPRLTGIRVVWAVRTRIRGGTRVVWIRESAGIREVPIQPDMQMVDSGRLTVFREGGGICLVETAEIYYFESVDDRVFAYVKDDVAEVKQKLYELEDRLAGGDFIRISKSMILNLSKVKRFAPYMGGRFEALLENGEKALISRQYVPELKKVLGL